MATASLAWGLQVGIGFRLMSSLEVWPLPWNMQPCNSYNSVSGWILQVGNYRWTERQWWWLYVLADLWQYSVALLLLQELVLGWDTNGDFLSGTFQRNCNNPSRTLQMFSFEWSYQWQQRKGTPRRDTKAVRSRHSWVFRVKCERQFVGQNAPKWFE